VGYLCANFSLSIGLSVLDLGPMYATDTSDVHRRLIPPPYGGWGITSRHFWDIDIPFDSKFLETCPQSPGIDADADYSQSVVYIIHTLKLTGFV